MKQILAIALALLVLAAPAVALNQYGWRISSSQFDPFASVGGIAPGGLAHLYLWYWCSDQGGMSAADFALAGTGTIFVVGFLPLNGFLNAGSGLNLLLAVGGCPTGPVVAGDITVLSLGGAADVCIVPSNTGLRVTMDCAAPTPNAWPLYATAWGALGVPACQDNFFCGYVATEPKGWGSIKGLYR